MGEGQPLPEQSQQDRLPLPADSPRYRGEGGADRALSAHKSAGIRGVAHRDRGVATRSRATGGRTRAVMNNAYDPIVGRKIRVALVGCGRIAQKHFEALQAHREHTELVAVCDTDRTALQAALAATGARGFPALNALLEGCDAEVIVLCTPSGEHCAQTMQFAAAGRHAITEKPRATRGEDVKRMVDACDAANVLLFVVKQNRRNATLQLLKRAVEQKRFGRIYMV